MTENQRCSHALPIDDFCAQCEMEWRDEEIERLRKLSTQFQLDNSALVSRLTK